jgi:preprotein translocase, YajC subunit
MGFITAADAASKSSGSSLTFPILIVLVFVGFYFLMIRPQRRRQQKVQQEQRTVATGARVRTTAGMYATVTEVDGDDVVLEVAPGVEVRYLKRPSWSRPACRGDRDLRGRRALRLPRGRQDEPADGTAEDSDDVKSAEDGLTDSHDDLAKSDKDNVH